MTVEELKVKRYLPTEISTDQKWSVLKLSGNDTSRFLQGQTTNDLADIPPGFGVLNSRVDRGGKIQAIFITLRDTDSWYVVIESELFDILKEELEKFIIMDDVELTEIKTVIHFYMHPASCPQEEKVFQVNLAGVPGAITLEKKLEIAETLSVDESVLLGFPVKGYNWNTEQLLTESSLHKSVVSLSKGCFLGQEVLAKILNNRGPSAYQALIEIDCKEGDDLISIEEEKIGKVQKVLGNGNVIASVSRKFAVKKRKYGIKTEAGVLEVVPDYLPLFDSKDRSALSCEVYEFGTQVFKYDEENAIKWFERAIEIDPNNQDACESLGVCLGRMGLFEKGIELMDELLKLNPDSVMAHTNKSLFLMKLGKIEEAEEEKSLATVAGFKQLGQESKQKKMKQELEEKEREDLERKKGMFLQVLEIDADDIIANFGLGEYYFKSQEYQTAINYLEKTLTLDSGYSRAYLILGKCYLKDQKRDLAVDVFNKGIKVATEKGELMPANEMQEQLASLQ